MVNAYPLILPFLVLPAEGPEALAPGRLALGATVAYGNAFIGYRVLYPPPDPLYVLIDAEVLKPPCPGSRPGGLPWRRASP